MRTQTGSPDVPNIPGSEESVGISDPIPFRAIWAAIVADRTRILAVATFLVAAAAAFVLLHQRKYVSTASFSVQGSGTRSMSGIAAQFGLSLPTQESTESPSYYMELLDSRAILTAAAESKYPVGGKTVKSLAEIYGVGEDNPAVSTEEAIKKLQKEMTVSKSRETGIVTVSVGAPSAVMAQAVLSRLLALLNDFNLRTRQSQAANERRFVEQRLTEVSADLRGAEDRLQRFLQGNRGSFANTPELSFQHDRLSRDLVLRQQVYNSLSQSYEQARIDEVRDSPAITTIDSPSFPLRPASRGLVRTTLLAGLVGLAFGALLSGLRVLWGSSDRERSGPPVNEVGFAEPEDSDLGRLGSAAQRLFAHQKTRV